jgi:hypothetical protein
MKFKEWVAEAQKLLAEKPEAGELEVYMSRDEEGNGFNKPFCFSYCEGMVDKLDYCIDGFRHDQDTEYHQECDPDYVYKSNIIVIWP